MQEKEAHKAENTGGHNCKGKLNRLRVSLRLCKCHQMYPLDIIVKFENQYSKKPEGKTTALSSNVLSTSQGSLMQ